MAIVSPYQPVKISGGIARMLKAFESLRDANTGGYGSGIVANVDGWAATKSTVTSCSPFTATVVAMVFDPAGDDSVDKYKPVIDGGKPLPYDFYRLHNSVYSFPQPKADDAPDVAKKKNDQRAMNLAIFKKNKWPLAINSSNGSLAYFNLGYEIDPRDMRRGDHVAIDWNSGGGHSTFCWDVHLNEAGDVDCFQYCSSNGWMNPTLGGPGVTVGGTPSSFLPMKKPYAKAKSPLFADYKEYVESGDWQALPKTKPDSISKKSFSNGTPKSITYSGKYAVNQLHVTRLWGIAPPTSNRDGDKFAVNFAKATELTIEQPPVPFAMTPADGSAAPPPEVHIRSVPPVVVKGTDLAANPDAPKTAPSKPAAQQKDDPVAHQKEVEDALQDLFKAGWIGTDPGSSDDINSAETQAAVKDFQGKYALKVDGIAGPKTRAALRQAVADLKAGKPNPHPAAAGAGAQGGAGAATPTVDHVYWLHNNVDVGGTGVLQVRGSSLGDQISFTVSLVNASGGDPVPVALPLIAAKGIGSLSIPIPASFALGAKVNAKISGTAGDGTKLDATTEATLNIGPIPQAKPFTPAGVLKKLGYFDGADDATADQLKDAITSFQTDKRSIKDLKLGKPNGTLDAPTMRALASYNDKLSGAPAGMVQGRRWRFTRYFIIAESDCSSTTMIPMLDGRQNLIANVKLDFFANASLEGTGKLADGRLVNVAKRISLATNETYRPVYDWSTTHMRKAAFGGVTMKADGTTIAAVQTFTVMASPMSHGYRMVAFQTLAGDIGYYNSSEPKFKGKGKGAGLAPIGTKVFIPDLVGFKLPDGTIHDGNCTVNDTGSAIAGAHFDIFSGSKSDSKSANGKIPEIGSVWYDGLEAKVPVTYTYGLTPT